MSISTENAKDIRNPMKVRIGISAKLSDVGFYINSAGYYYGDYNWDETLLHDDWPAHPTTLKAGFPLDTDTVWADLDTPATSATKVGVIVREQIAGEPGYGSFDLRWTSAVSAVTIYFTAGDGYVEVGGVQYPVAPTVVVPVTGRSVNIEVYNTSENYMQISAIVPGVVVEWSEDDIIDCTLALRADLSDNPTWPVSELQMTAYWPSNLAQAIANLPEGSPVYYQAGYEGDMSPIRHFYLCEPATLNKDVITLHAQDSSYKLEKKTVIPQLITADINNGKNALWNFFKKIIKNCGISPKVVGTEPKKVTESKTVHNIIFLEGSTRDHVANFMNTVRSGNDFSPVFVDAGIPKLFVSSQGTQLWQLDENNIGDLEYQVSPHINSLVSSTEYDIVTGVTRKSTWDTLDEPFDVKAGNKYIKNYSNWHWVYSITNQRTRNWTTLSGVSWIANKTTTKDKKGKKSHQCSVKGKGLTISTTNKVVSNTALYGQRGEYAPLTLGKVLQGTAWVSPNYGQLSSNSYGIMKRSTVTGTFTYKGDPRMQPRDRLRITTRTKSPLCDIGETFLATVESIELHHSGGGTSATITFRAGVI